MYNIIADGVISNEDGQQYYLKFEVKEWDETAELVTSVVNKVRQSHTKEYFRKWVVVPFDQMKDIKVQRFVCEKGEYFVSDTSQYLPIWLRHIADMEPIPEDEKGALP